MSAVTDFAVGQTVTLTSWSGKPLESVIEDGYYVIIDMESGEPEDVAHNWETAESYAMGLGESGLGYLAVKVTADGSEVMQGWRDLVTDCYGIADPVAA